MTLRLLANYAQAFIPNGLSFSTRWSAARYRHHTGMYKTIEQRIKESNDRKMS